MYICHGYQRIKYVRMMLEAWRVCLCQERQKQRASLLPSWWGRADSHGFRPMESQAFLMVGCGRELEHPLGRSLKRPWIFYLNLSKNYYAFWACHLKACKPLHCTEGSTRWGRWRRLSREVIPWASSEGWQSPASMHAVRLRKKGPMQLLEFLLWVGVHPGDPTCVERPPDMSPSPGTQTKWMSTTLAPKLNVWRSKSSRPPTEGFFFLMISTTWLLTYKNPLVSYASWTPNGFTYGSPLGDMSVTKIKKRPTKSYKQEWILESLLLISLNSYAKVISASDIQRHIMANRRGLCHFGWPGGGQQLRRCTAAADGAKFWPACLLLSARAARLARLEKNTQTANTNKTTLQCDMMDVEELLGWWFLLICLCEARP